MLLAIHLSEIRGVLIAGERRGPDGQKLRATVDRERQFSPRGPCEGRFGGVVKAILPADRRAGEGVPWRRATWVGSPYSESGCRNYAGTLVCRPSVIRQDGWSDALRSSDSANPTPIRR